MKLTIPHKKIANIADNTQRIILEGGANGHLLHIIDNGNFTFSDIHDIFKQVFSGRLELREKTDGIAFTITIKDRVLYSARNKTELRNPLNFEQTVAKFSDRPPAVRNAFVTSFTDMNNALQALSDEELYSIFENGEKYLSFEIISADAKNLIHYGSKAMIILHGINIYDDNWTKIADDPEAAKKLHAYFEKRGVLNQDTYAIQGPVVLQIKNRTHAADALKELTADLNEVLDGIPASTTLIDYVVTKIQPQLQDLAIKSGIGKVMTDDNVKRLMSRSNMKMGMPLTKINDVIMHIADHAYDVTHSQIKSFIHAVVLDVTTLANEAIMPVWAVIAKAGVLIVKCVQGFLAADPSGVAKQLSQQLDEIASSDAASKLTPNNLARFNKALKQLDKFNRETFGTEGVVFTYNNTLYKLTSTFGPLNQLLGLFKYSKDTTQTDAVAESLDAHTTVDDDTPIGAIPRISFRLSESVLTRL